MRTSIPMVAAGILAVGSAALAAEATSPSGGEARPGTRLQGSPNAAGYTGQGGTTGSPNTGAPGSEMPETDGRMKGPPNAAGFQQGGGTGAAGSR